MTERDTCPVFPVRSGAPIVGLGIFIVAIAIVMGANGDRDAFPIPLAALLAIFGLFLVWLGMTK